MAMETIEPPPARARARFVALYRLFQRKPAV